MGRTNWGIDNIRGGGGLCDCIDEYRVSTLGQDIEISWDAYAPFGYGYGNTAWGYSSYGGIAHAAFRGYVIEVYFIVGGQDHLVRKDHTWTRSYVYLEAHNRWDVKHCGCLGTNGFQSTVKFKVYPVTEHGKGVALTYTTTTSAADPKITNASFATSNWAISKLTPAADKIIYFTSDTQAALTTLTSFARTLIDDVDAPAARTTLGLGTVAVKNVGDFSTVDQVHFQDFRVRALTGAHATTPTLAIGDAGQIGAGDPQLYFSGFVMADAVVSWGAFGFAVPDWVEAGSDIGFRVCFVINGAGTGCDLDFYLIGSQFRDDDSSGTPSNVFDVHCITSIDVYAAGDYAIKDLGGVSLAVSPGEYIQGVLERDATSGDDSYADLIGLTWIEVYSIRRFFT